MPRTSSLRASDNGQRRPRFSVPNLEMLEDRLQPGSLLVGQSWDFLASSLMRPDPALASSVENGTRSSLFRLTTPDQHQKPSPVVVDLLAGSGQRLNRGAVAPPAVGFASAKDSSSLVGNEWLALSAARQSLVPSPAPSPAGQAQHLSAVDVTVGLRNDRTELSAIPTHIQAPQHLGGDATQRWATYVTNTPTSATGQGITQDSNGNVYVTGSTDEGGTKAAFVAGYDPTGVQLFFKKFQAKDVTSFPGVTITYNHSEGHALALDGNGNLYVTGKATNPLTRLQDAFVMRFGNTGNVDPSYGVGFDTGGQGNVIGNSIVVTPDGTATIAGSARLLGNDIRLHNDIFMAVIASNGSVVENATHAFDPRGFADGQGQQVFTDTVANGIAVSADGTVAYISGTGTHAGGDTDIMLMVVDTATGGQTTAGFSYVPNAGPDSGNGVVVGLTGNVYQVGTTTQQANGQSVTYATVISWSADISAASYGVFDTNTISGSGIAVDPVGNVFMTGTAADIVGNTRAFVEVLDSAGAVPAGGTLLIADNGSGQESGAAIVFSPDGTVYLTGTTSSSNLSTDGSGLNGTQDAFLANVGGFAF